MNVLARLKPIYGPIGSAIGTWLDFVPSGLGVRFFFLWFVILWTAFQIISFASVGLNPDLLELYAWGLHPAAGYYKHPPLGALMVGGWFSLFPPTDWGFHLLAMLNAMVGLLATERIGRLYLAGDKRILVLLLLLLTPFYQFHAQRFGANQTLLSTWPIATYCFLRAFETRAIAWSVAAGVTAALAMLGKYYSVFLIAGFVAAVVTSPLRWTYLRSLSPWLSVLAGGLMLAPHVQWLIDNHFMSFSYAADLHAGAPLGDVLIKDASYVAGGIAYVGVLLAVYWLTVRPSLATLRETLWPSDPAGRMLVVLLATPLVLPAIVAPFIGAELTSLWTMSGWFLLPIVLLRPAQAQVTRTAAIRITVLIILITLGSLAAAPLLAWRYHNEGTKEGREYYRQIAAEASNSWHMNTGLPLHIVMGDPYLAEAITFYSPDHPDAVPGFRLDAAPWVTPQRLSNEGWVTVCRADDENCIAQARQAIHDRNDVPIITYATTNRYLGSPGKLARFYFLLVPPEAAPRIQVR